MENKIIPIPEGYVRQIQEMAVTECANCVCGECLLLDDGDPCICPQSSSHSLWCRYFLRAVLPAHRELYFKLCGIGLEKLCSECGAPFYPKSNRAKYCDRCRRIVKLRKTREGMRLIRGSM